MYSHVIDSITYKNFLSFAVDKKVETRLMGVIIVYLYGNLDIDMYMKIHVVLVEFQNSQRQPQFLKLERALYNLK